MNGEAIQSSIQAYRDAVKDRQAARIRQAYWRDRIDREKNGVLVEVSHPEIGSIRVKARSKYDARCAAEEELGLPELSLRGCTVRAIIEDGQE